MESSTQQHERDNSSAWLSEELVTPAASLLPSVPQAGLGISRLDQFNLYFIYIIILCGLPLNLATIVAVIKSRVLQQEKTIHHLMFSLVVSDFITCLTAQPFLIFNTTVNGLRYIIGKKWACITTLICNCIAFESTAMGVLLLNCDRFMAIVMPMQHRKLASKKSIRFIILLSWTVLLLKTTISVVFWNTWSPYKPCTGLAMFSINYNVYGYFVPMLVTTALIIIININIGYIALGRSKGLKGQKSLATTVGEANNKENASKAKQDLKILKMLMLVVGVFLVTYMPFIIIGNIVLVHYVNQQRHPPMWLVHALALTRPFSAVSLVADPIIYVWNNNKAREVLKKSFGFRTSASVGPAPRV